MSRVIHFEIPASDPERAGKNHDTVGLAQRRDVGLRSGAAHARCIIVEAEGWTRGDLAGCPGDAA